MTCYPSPIQQANAYIAMHKVIKLIEAGEIKGFDLQTVKYMKVVSLYEKPPRLFTLIKKRKS
jgi:hypothetical protein